MYSCHRLLFISFFALAVIYLIFVNKNNSLIRFTASKLFIYALGFDHRSLVQSKLSALCDHTHLFMRSHASPTKGRGSILSVRQKASGLITLMNLLNADWLDFKIACVR